MPAKNTAVNLMILFTALSFLYYRRSNKIATVSWVKAGQCGAGRVVYSVGIINILILGIYYGYFTNTVYKVAASVPQVLTTLVVIVLSTVIDSLIYKEFDRGGATEVGQGAGPRPVRPVPAGCRIYLVDGLDGLYPFRYSPALACDRCVSG